MSPYKNLFFLAFMATCLLARLVNAQDRIDGTFNGAQNAAGLAVDLGGAALETGMNAAGGAVDVAGGTALSLVSGPIDMVRGAIGGVGNALTAASDIVDPNA